MFGHETGLSYCQTLCCIEQVCPNSLCQYETWIPRQHDICQPVIRSDVFLPNINTINSLALYLFCYFMSCSVHLRVLLMTFYVYCSLGSSLALDVILPLKPATIFIKAVTWLGTYLCTCKTKTTDFSHCFLRTLSFLHVQMTFVWLNFTHFLWAS